MTNLKTDSVQTTDKCPSCGNGILNKVHGQYETVFNDGEDERSLQVPGVDWLECPACGETLLGNIALKKIDQAKYEALGLLSPSDILALREKFGKTQEEMADILRVGSKTYCRWENGHFFQTKANDNYLRLVFWLVENVVDPVQVLAGLSLTPSPKGKTPMKATSTHFIQRFMSTRQFEPNILLHRNKECCLQS